MKITCKQCGKEFELSQSEINFYRSKNLSLPKRCKECREKNKQPKGSSTQNTAASQSANIPEAASEMQKHTYTSKPVRDTRLSTNKIGFFSVIALIAIIAATLFFLFSDNGNADVPTNGLNTEFTDAITDFVSDISADLKSGESTQPKTEAPDIDTKDKETSAEVETAPSSDPSENTEPDVLTEQQPQNTTPGTAPENSEEATPSADTSVNTEADVTAEQPQNTTAAPESAEETTMEQRNDLRFRSSSLLEQHYQKHGIEMGFASAEEYEKAAAAVVNDSRVLHKTEAEDGDDVYYIEETNEFVVVSTDGYIRTYFNPNRGINYFYDQ